MYRSVVVLMVTLAGCSSASTPAVSRGTGTSRGSAGSGPSNPVSTGNGANGAAGGASGLLTNANKPAAGPNVITDPNVCAMARVNATRLTPTVLFVLDGSSSMNATFASGTRWSVLRDTLVGPMGVITTLESSVKFGSTIYSSNQACPALTEVAPALSNLMAISAAYPTMEPGVGTPTGEALQKVVDGLPDYASSGPDAVGAPPIIILATDGEPNGCGGIGAASCDWLNDLANCILNTVGTAAANYDSTFAAVRTAKQKGIPVWVVSMADGLNSIPDLQKTANIGAGLADDASPPAPIYSPQTASDLTNTLSALIGAATSCEVLLAGELDVTRACEGSVQMNGSPLVCNDAQGWKPVDATHIALQGAACDKFKSDPSVLLDARFPCDVVTLQ